LRPNLRHAVIRPKRIKQWTFYKRDEPRIKALKRAILDNI
jgi:hypothetical protein